MDWKAIGKKILDFLKKVFIRAVKEEVCSCSCDKETDKKTEDTPRNSDNP